MAHKHICLDCGAIIEEGSFDCESDTDHDFEKCKICLILEQHGSEMERGYALNTAAAQYWLNSCPAVFVWREHDEEYIDFVYRTDIEVPVVHPSVHFDRDIFNIPE